MVAIRELRPDETAFLREMLYAAIAWNPERRLPLPAAELLQLPQLTMFHEGWGRRGDTALVAEEDGRLLGLAWYRFFTEAEHGEGYVDEQTPEVAVAVIDERRGSGDRHGADGGDPRARAGRRCRADLAQRRPRQSRAASVRAARATSRSRPRTRGWS